MNMTDFVTSAKTIDEIDLALLELTSLTDGPATYVGRALFRVATHKDRVLTRSAYVIGATAMDHLIEEPSAWATIRADKPEGLKDHSSHNLFPFEGKLLPKVARALINIATLGNSAARVCDPFCGSGTIPLEASIMGHPIFANDLDPFAAWLTQAKLTQTTNNLIAFIEQMKKVGLGDHSEVVPAHVVCLPKTWTLVECGDAVDFLRDTNCDAIVTSPPYFSAIDYNFRHSEYRKRLKLSEPKAPGLGFTEGVVDYEQSIRKICFAMSAAVTKGGRIVIVIGDNSGVPSTMWYELYLKEAGLTVFDRLKRPYEHVTRGFAEDNILVMEKR